MMGLRAAVLVLIVFCMHGCAYTENRSTSKQSEVIKKVTDQFQEELRKLHVKGRFPGATAAFVLADGWHAGFATGYADIENGIRMTPSARMLSGSTGKSFTAAVVLSLVLEGRLDLDAPISLWFKEEPWFQHLPNAYDITLRMLLRHQSGLIDHIHSKQFATTIRNKLQACGPDAYLTPENLVALVLDTKPLFRAGSGYAYSDTNYILAGMIIERVTGNSYYEELRQRFIRPLNLKLTSPANGRHLPGLVAGYIKGNTPFGLPNKVAEDETLVYNPLTEWTGGGLISNSQDLAYWAKVLYEGKAMQGAYLNELLEAVPKDESQRVQFGPDVRYGLGVTIRETSLGTAYGHRGWAPGYLSMFEYYPAYRVAVALQINEQGDHDMAAYLESLANVLVKQEIN